MLGRIGRKDSDTRLTFGQYLHSFPLRFAGKQVSKNYSGISVGRHNPFSNIWKVRMEGVECMTGTQSDNANHSPRQSRWEDARKPSAVVGQAR